MWILIDSIKAVGIESTRSADNAVDFVVFFKEKARQVRSVLACNAGYEGFFHDVILR
jgi:hypothetical protein